MIEMIPVSSSNIRSIGFEDHTLYIIFHTGHRYAYYGVPEHVFKALLSASSKGKYFTAHIKNNYRHSKMR